MSHDINQIPMQNNNKLVLSWFHVILQNNPVPQLFSRSGEQPEQRILAVGCIAIFHKLLLYKVWGYYNKCDSMKSLGYITDMSKCYGTGVWSMNQNILRFMITKHIAHLAACSGSPLVRDGPLRADVWDILPLMPFHQELWLMHITVCRY